MNGDQADRARILGVAVAGGDHGAARPEAVGGLDQRLDQVAILGAAGVALAHRPGVAGALVGRHDAGLAVAAAAEHADDADIGLVLQPAHGAAGPAAVLVLLQPRQHPVADRQRALAAAFGGHADARRRLLLLPAHRLGQGLAVGVDGDDAQHRDIRQGRRARRPHAAAAALLQLALLGHVLQQLLQPHPVVAGDVEGAGDLALADRVVARLQELGDLLARRERLGRLLALAQRRLGRDDGLDDLLPLDRPADRRLAVGRFVHGVGLGSGRPTISIGDTDGRHANRFLSAAGVCQTLQSIVIRAKRSDPGAAAAPPSDCSARLRLLAMTVRMGVGR